MINNKHVEELNSTEFMMNYCRSKIYNFQLLWNDHLFSTERRTDIYNINNNVGPTIESVLYFNSNKEMDSLKNHVDYGRIAMNLQQE